MANRTETKIAEALFAKLGTLTLSPAVPVAWPNVAFAPPADAQGKPAPFLRVNDIPAPTRGLSIADTGTNEYVGLFQVDVMWPHGGGVSAAKETAGAIVAHMKRGTRLDRQSVRVDVTQASVGPVISDDPRIMIPVTITYRALVKNV